MEDIKRNYIALTLLFISFILFFIDMTAGIVTNICSIVAFGFTEQIVKYIASTEKKHQDDSAFYEAVEKYKNGS